MTCTSACKLARIAGMMGAQYCLIVLNTRFIALHSYPGTIGTDAVLAFNGLMLTRYAVQADTWLERFAYVAGGCIGSAMALWIT